jgi:hypothetical protein
MTGINDLIERRLQEERQAIADWLASENKPSSILLRGGEMSLAEMRSVRAFLHRAEEMIRAGHYKQEAGK